MAQISKLPIASGFIKTAEYDADARSLTVEFWGSDPRTHKNVTPEIVDELCHAQSPGNYYIKTFVPIYKRSWFKRRALWIAAGVLFVAVLAMRLLR